MKGYTKQQVLEAITQSRGVVNSVLVGQMHCGRSGVTTRGTSGGAVRRGNRRITLLGTNRRQ